MRRAQNTDTHAHKQHRLSQNISPVSSSFVLVIASDMHLKSDSEKRAKNVDFHTTKSIQIQSTLFRYFQTNSLSADFRPIYCSLTTWLGWREIFQPLTSEEMASSVDVWEGQRYLWDPADKDCKYR